MLRAWAIEGTGGHGAGLSRHLLAWSRSWSSSTDPSGPSDATARSPTPSMRSVPHVRRWHGPARHPAQRGRPPGSVGAAGGPPLGGRGRHRGPAAGVQPGHRRTRTDPCAVPGQKLAAMLNTAAGLRVHVVLGRRDDHHGAGVAVLGTSSPRAEGGSRAAEAILAIVRSWRPDLLEQFGVGPIVAATVLCAWSHPGRIHSEAAFAMLAGVAPIPANSGQVTNRYRLNHYGDRQLNRALHTVVQSRIHYQTPPATTSPAAPPRARPAARSNAAWPATSPETSTAYSKVPPQRLDEP